MVNTLHIHTDMWTYLDVDNCICMCCNSFVVVVICMCSSLVFQWVSSLLLPNGCNVIHSLILCVISLLPGATWNTTGEHEPVCLMWEGDSCVSLFPFSHCLTAVFYLHTTGNAWNITASEYCTPTSSSNTVRIMVVMCCCFLLPPTSVGESDYL